MTTYYFRAEADDDAYLLQNCIPKAWLARCYPTGPAGAVWQLETDLNIYEVLQKVLAVPDGHVIYRTLRMATAPSLKVMNEYLRMEPMDGGAA